MKPCWSDYVYYDETSPSGLRWSVHASNYKYKKGDCAGHLDEDGYRRLKINKRTYLTHRIVYELTNRCSIISRYQIDHIDGWRTNNKVENLRVVSQIHNARNHKKRADNISGVAGVCFVESKNSWLVQCSNADGSRKVCWVSAIANPNAFELACFIREETIELFNMRGFNYAASHGRRL